MFDELDNGISSEGFNELNLNHFDDENEDVDANDQDQDEKKIMQELIQSLEDVEDKKVKQIGNSQPNLVTKAQDMERQLECTISDTTTRDSSKEIATSSLNDIFCCSSICWC